MTVKELAKANEISIYKVRKYTKDGILKPIGKDRDDGKTFLYHPVCAEIKLEILFDLSLEYSKKELAKRFKEVFGKRDENLLKELESSKGRRKEGIIRKFTKEIENLDKT